jgi:hypothetical protein
MTEAEWLTFSNPLTMIEGMRKGSDRKLRLFSCAFCRSVWNQLVENRSQTAIEVAESFADGALGDAELEIALREANLSYTAGNIASACAALCAEPYDPRSKPEYFPDDEFYDGFANARDVVLYATDSFTELSNLLREIFGNPFRPVAFSPSWSTSTVTNLAQSVYEDRHLPSGLFDNQRMGVLADALEEAGCDNADILGHLRAGVNHVRGCWAVDLILGKE